MLYRLPHLHNISHNIKYDDRDQRGIISLSNADKRSFFVNAVSATQYFIITTAFNLACDFSIVHVCNCCLLIDGIQKMYFQ